MKKRSVTIELEDGAFIAKASHECIENAIIYALVMLEPMVEPLGDTAENLAFDVFGKLAIRELEGDFDRNDLEFAYNDNWYEIMSECRDVVLTRIRQLAPNYSSQ